MSVTAVIPNWNRRDLLLGLLRDWQAQSLSPAHTIVVDNGSTDGSAQAAQAQGATVITLPENRGFAYAVNRGIEAAGTEWIAILNNDVHLPAHWLERLLDAARHRDAWFATGRLLRAAETSTLDGSFDLLSRSGCAWRAGNGKPDTSLWSTDRTICSAPFTAALFRKSLFERTGLLDERFESYLEDVDFGLRCAKAGLNGIYVGDVAATHEASATLGRWNPETVRRIARNQLLLIAKHYPAGWIWRYGWPVLIGQGLWGLVAAKHGAGGAYLRGKWEGIAALRRQPRSPHEPNLDPVLRQSEQQIQTLQREAGYDWFWRLYFLLT
ncbi:MAG: glycosyltransferase family 2 protein [Acidobacteria bacterium]|nr:glycosyltransferase family 2 protein [Acidobacteriota bacterium]